ncbi:elongation factor P maturation arginine rhamnosyltransferase EarP [Diaphorobacter sp. HDW4B]|uniref:elongation factor P maturation arginine rhamnosyltransferase EarP n=1 Tax=Diaphorobacter sp. HDW4B TaxID=2714925 RepID=UPI00140D86C3|nr:elongation factor P maturation arginine rhamnosyltransferase EarP [Diaphorobacter sp. HDW4B]QIL72445.1 elongation factor P maturation arginine rhamnosyltransferase EarP [Diaphorobacter sp. HDW4B]
MNSSPQQPQRWDIFCQVIDNFGDVGVCWRLAADLGARGHRVRLFIDDASALQWMAPNGAQGVTVHPWPTQAPQDDPGDVVIEAFGCEIPEAVIAAIAQKTSDGKNSLVWINLEYLSAESYVERCHALPSPIMSGPAAGLTRWFFYPGFTEPTGGLLREPDLAARQAAFDRDTWRAKQGLAKEDTAFSLFCYEPPAFPQVFADHRFTAQWLVTPGRAAAMVRAALLPAHSDNLRFLPPVTQPEFDEMLWACDLNFVRGEDSLVRALWAGQPFIWQIYPQHDNAHHEKLDAFLDWMQAPPSLRAAHAVWNELPEATNMPTISKDMLAEWRACTQSAKARLWAQNDLLTQLLGFVAEKS